MRAFKIPSPSRKRGPIRNFAKSTEKRWIPASARMTSHSRQSMMFSPGQQCATRGSICFGTSRMDPCVRAGLSGITRDANSQNSVTLAQAGADPKTLSNPPRKAGSPRPRGRRSSMSFRSPSSLMSSPRCPRPSPRSTAGPWTGTTRCSAAWCWATPAAPATRRACMRPTEASPRITNTPSSLRAAGPSSLPRPDAHARRCAMVAPSLSSVT